LHGRSAVTDNNSTASLVDEQRMHKELFRTCFKNCRVPIL